MFLSSDLDVSHNDRVICLCIEGKYSLYLSKSSVTSLVLFIQSIIPIYFDHITYISFFYFCRNVYPHRSCLPQ